MRRFLTGALAFSLVLTMSGTAVMAQEEQSGVTNYLGVQEATGAIVDATGTYEYVVNEDGTAKITNYVGTTEGSNIEIPELLDGYPVTVLGLYSFKSCVKASAIYIPACVTTIEEGAFQNVQNVTITLAPENNNYKIVNNTLFSADGKTIIHYWDKAETYAIPEDVERIGIGAFASNEALVKLTIGSGVKTIGSNAFYFCQNLTNLVIPDNVTDVESYAFASCKSLETVKIGKGLTEISQACFISAGIDEIVIPSNIKVINDEAFEGCFLKNIVIEDGIETIRRFAFAFNEIETITIPASVVDIRDNVLSNCRNLKEVFIEGNIDKISEGFFIKCGVLKNVHIPASVKIISKNAFGECDSLENVYFGGSENQWKQVEIDSNGNNALNNATIHFESNLNSFVERMYTTVLGRNADLDGLNAWVQMLETGMFDGAGLAKEFVLGQEFTMRNISDEEYVDVLYETFFDRAADETGRMLWMGELAAGKSRAYVLSKFVNLPEFTSLCGEYDILRGVMFEDGNVATTGCVQFVERLYDLVMGRDADSEGLYTWTYALTYGIANAQSVATQFFNGAEYAAANKSNEAYVTDLYGVFMDRTPDESGLAFWVSCLTEQGVSRDWVLSEFAKSEEFKMIAAKYGIQ